MKLGKKPFVDNGKDFKLSSYAVVPLPKVPVRFGHGSIFADWGMLGNDLYGDCVFAGADHETMLFNKLGVAKKKLPFTAVNALSDYSAVTGFDPNEPGSDNGTEVRQALSYRRKTGVVDAKGNRHKIGAYVSIDPKNWLELMQATYTFGAVGIGFEFPESAMGQFNNGQIWDVVPGSPIEGGHYTPVVGSMSSSKKGTLVTWGKRQEFTRAFYEAYNDESWVFLSPEILNSAGTFRGLDISALAVDLAALA